MKYVIMVSILLTAIMSHSQSNPDKLLIKGLITPEEHDILIQQQALKKDSIEKAIRYSTMLHLGQIDSAQYNELKSSIGRTLENPKSEAQKRRGGASLGVGIASIIVSGIFTGLAIHYNQRANNAAFSKQRKDSANNALAFGVSGALTAALGIGLTIHGGILLRNSNKTDFVKTF